MTQSLNRHQKIAQNEIRRRTAEILFSCKGNQDSLATKKVYSWQTVWKSGGNHFNQMFRSYNIA